MNLPKPVLNEIAVIDREFDITRDWIGPLLPSQDSVLREKGASDLLLYEEVLRDEQVQSCYAQRFTGLTSCDWVVDAGGDRRIDLKAADFIREQLNGIPWDDICYKHLYAIHYGYSLAECLWMRDEGGKIVFDDTKGGIRVRNRRRFRFDYDLQPKLLTWNDRWVGMKLPPRKFWTFSVGADNHDDPYGRGLGHWLYWLTYFKRSDMRVWLRYLEKYSQPTAVAKYNAGMKDDEQRDLLKAARSLANASAIKIPEGAFIELLEASRSGTADYQALWDTCNAGISKVILSQTMTTDNGSSLSQAEVHQGVARRVIKSDADLICKSFSRGPLRWLIDWNYPGAAYPSVWRRTDAEGDLKTQADRDKVLFDMGFVPSQKYVQETYGEGFALPGTDEAPAALNGTQLDSILQIVDAIQSGSLGVDVGQELIKLAVPTIAEDIAARIAAPPNAVDGQVVDPASVDLNAIGQLFSGNDARSTEPAPTPEPQPVPEPPAETPLEQTTQPTTPAFSEQGALLFDVLQALDGALEFAAKKGSKGGKGGKKDCKKGLSCGKSCIQKDRACISEMSASQKKRYYALMKKVKAGGAEAQTAIDKIIADQVAAKLGDVKPAQEPAPVKKSGIAELSPDSIEVDPKRFQYKVIGAYTATGEVGSLSGVKKFDPNLAGIVQVWVDPADGKTYVVNGHNRLALAKRAGAESVVVRYLDVASAKEARSVGALTNIAEGRGTAIDAAKFFRDSGLTKEDLDARGIPMREKIATDGIALSKLEDSLFRKVIDGDLTVDRAAIIGGSGLDGQQQTSLMKVVDSQSKKRKITNEVLTELVDGVKASERKTEMQFDLFGGSQVTIDNALERAALQSAIKKKLSREKKLFGTVGRSTAAKQLESAGNVIDIQSSKQVSQDAGTALSIFDQLKNQSGGISQAVNKAATEIASGGDRKKIEADLYKEILSIVKGGKFQEDETE